MCWIFFRITLFCEPKLELLFKFIDFLIQQLSPLLLIVQIDNLIDQYGELNIYDTKELSLLYAATISDGLNHKLGFKIREVKQANFQVLRKTLGFCLAILLELGYLSNTDESEYLNNKEKRKALALVILMAI